MKTLNKLDVATKPDIATTLDVAIKLDQFEGPLSLLLYLIKKEEMNIYDIPISKITSQYLEELKIIESLNLDIAGDFVAMAATLIQIKSKMLLPNPTDDDEEYEDPRAKLVKQLLDYKKYKQKAAELRNLDIVGRDLFLRGMKEDFRTKEEINIDESSLFNLSKMYKKLLNSVKNKVHIIAKPSQSIYSRIMELKSKFVSGSSLTFKDLYKPEGESKLVVTFLSILELGKLGFVSLFQRDNESNIHIKTKKVPSDNIISNLDRYKGVKADG